MNPFAEFTLADGRKLWVGYPVVIDDGSDRAQEDRPTMYGLGCVVELSRPKRIKNADGLTAELTADSISLSEAFARMGADGTKLLETARDLLPVIDAQAKGLGVDQWPWWVAERVKFQGELTRLGRQHLYAARNQEAVRPAATEEKSDEAILRMRAVVTDALMAEFAEMRTPLQYDADIPRDVQDEMHQTAGRIAWRQIAEESIFVLLESVKPASGDISLHDWAEHCLTTLNRAEFSEDTTLTGGEIDRAIRTAAKALVGWPEFRAQMPMLIGESVLTVVDSPFGRPGIRAQRSVERGDQGVA